MRADLTCSAQILCKPGYNESVYSFSTYTAHSELTLLMQLVATVPENTVSAQTGLRVDGQKLHNFIITADIFKQHFRVNSPCSLPEPDIACIPPGSHASGRGWLQLKHYYCQN